MCTKMTPKDPNIKFLGYSSGVDELGEVKPSTRGKVVFVGEGTSAYLVAV